MSVTTDRVTGRVAELEAQLASERAFHREQLTAVSWARMRDRFHAFDAIKNDSCPACGGRVKVEEGRDPEGVRLVAVGREHIDEAWDEAARLRDGIGEALRQMQAGRKTVAIATLKAVLSGETW
jgi:hypothetical protein